MRSALVLARGEPTAEESHARAVVERVGAVVDDVVVHCERGDRDAIAGALGDTDHRLVVHPTDAGGAVSRIRAGCRLARGRRTFVTTCSQPVTEPPLVETLFDRDEEAVVPAVDGHRRPLPGVYHTEQLLDACETTLGLGTDSVRELVARLSVATVGAQERDETEGPSTLRTKRAD